MSAQVWWFKTHHHSPDVLIGGFSKSFDGSALQLVLGPAGALARSVAVVSKFALAALLQLLLPAEATVANALRQAENGGRERFTPVDPNRYGNRKDKQRTLLI